MRPLAWFTHHPAHTALASTPVACAEAYRQLLREVLSDNERAAIRPHLRQQRVLGCDDFRTDDFRTMVEAKTQRVAGIRPAHRPPRSDKPQK